MWWLPWNPFFGFNAPAEKTAMQTVDAPPAVDYSLRVGRDGYAIKLSDYRKTGFRAAILASSGQGKSYLGGVLTEELLENNQMVVIIDPEGENYTLAEKYPLMIVGRKPAPDDSKTVRASISELDLDAADEEQLKDLCQVVLKGGVSVIFDLSDRIDKQQQELYTRIISCLFLVQQRMKRPITLIVEEAQIFAPQSAGKLPEIDGQTCLSISTHIAKRGRKYGINSLWMTQRPAALSKDVLSQCILYVLGGVRATVDVKALSPYLDEAGIEEAQIRALKSGEFYFCGNGLTRFVQVRKRKCKHGGAAPDASVQALPVADRFGVAKALRALKAGS